MRGRFRVAYGATLIAIATGLAIGVPIIKRNPTPPAPTVLANAFTAPAGTSGASPNCTPVSPAVDYPTALLRGAVCTAGVHTGSSITWSAFDNACARSTSIDGPIFGVKAGSYNGTVDNGTPMMDWGDCSGGRGIDFNPNWQDQGLSVLASGSTAHWAKFICADGDSSDVTFNITNLNFFYMNFHMDWEGGCFDGQHNSIGFGPGGGNPATQRPQNIIWGGNPATCKLTAVTGNCARLMGYDNAGGKNIWLRYINMGPFALCGQNSSAFVPTAAKCGTSFPWQSWWNGFPASSGCDVLNNIGSCGGSFTPGIGFQQQPLFRNQGSQPVANARISHIYDHDIQSTASQGTSSGGAGDHSGCYFTFGAYDRSDTITSNIVLDDANCERIAFVGIQMSANSFTIENSYFGCAAFPLDQTSPVGKWDSCSGNQEITVGTDEANCNLDTQSHFVIRNNVFLPNAGKALEFGGNSCVYLDGHVIGNIIMSPVSCVTSGIQWDYNSYAPGITPCGTNTTTLSGDPLVHSSTDTAGHLWSDTPTVDDHLSGAISVPTFPNLGANYASPLDADGTTRTFPTHAGAYN